MTEIVDGMTMSFYLIAIEAVIHVYQLQVLYKGFNVVIHTKQIAILKVDI